MYIIELDSLLECRVVLSIPFEITVTVAVAVAVAVAAAVAVCVVADLIYMCGFCESKTKHYET